MNHALTGCWPRTVLLIGVVLCIGGGAVYGIERTYNAFSDLVREAEVHYQAQRYREAITAYERVLNRSTTLPVRVSLLLLAIRPASFWLQTANCHYRLAEAELRHYQQAARDPRVTPRPSLGTVQRLLNAAGKAYEEVPQTHPQDTLAARVNGARVAAWQLILAAFDEQTTGRRSIRQQALQAIERAAGAVDYAHKHQDDIAQQERMTAILLLETLTAFSRERPPPSPPRPPNAAWLGRLGDLLLRHTPELSSQERQRFRQFFFALPLEARNPWPTARQGGAGGGRSQVAH